jgi:hypothetical protein
MGDRAVIGFKEDKDAVPVFLYSHWGGSDRYRDLQRALTAAQPRWNDAAYATRIAISQIVENYWKDETGFGISAGENSFCTPDYEDVPVVIWSDRRIVVVSAADSTQLCTTTMPVTLSFDEFLASVSC